MYGTWPVRISRLPLIVICRIRLMCARCYSTIVFCQYWQFSDRRLGTTVLCELFPVNCTEVFKKYRCGYNALSPFNLDYAVSPMNPTSLKSDKYGVLGNISWPSPKFGGCGKSKSILFYLSKSISRLHMRFLRTVSDIFALTVSDYFATRWI